MTPGVDGKSLDGMSEKRISALIESIKDFYLKIRNVVNHGGKIKQNVDVNKIILKCLDSVEKFIKEG